jgi:hypothetical protein
MIKFDILTQKRYESDPNSPAALVLNEREERLGLPRV